LTVTVLALLAVASGTAPAQEPKPAPEPAPAFVNVRPPAKSPPAIPLEVQVVISRFQGEKKISSLPYTLAVNSDNINAQLNVGANIPVPTTTFTPAGSDKPAPLVSYNYQNVGTNIDCRVTANEDGRFELTLGVDESTVVTNADGASGSVAGVPVMRNFKSRNRLLLRDGQTRQYTAATDRVNGETIRIEVTLRVVK
jgi:hypothetical protein